MRLHQTMVCPIMQNTSGCEDAQVLSSFWAPEICSKCHRVCFVQKSLDFLFEDASLCKNIFLYRNL